SLKTWKIPQNCWQRALLCCVLVAAWEAAWGQLRYSVPEELPKGSFVGDVAKDLALELRMCRSAKPTAAQ
uniref:Cadherin N-terminal domain-containing protein n=1 Tax=Coturnix japonica TaxID=93934 RepID=A0A8C2TJV7_COTJA